MSVDQYFLLILLTKVVDFSKLFNLFIVDFMCTKIVIILKLWEKYNSMHNWETTRQNINAVVLVKQLIIITHLYFSSIKKCNIE